MSVHDWGLHELSRKYLDDERRREIVLEQMNKVLDEREYDLYLMLGNFRALLYNFGLMGHLSVRRPKVPPSKRQLPLFS